MPKNKKPAIKKSYRKPRSSSASEAAPPTKNGGNPTSPDPAPKAAPLEAASLQVPQKSVSAQPATEAQRSAEPVQMPEPRVEHSVLEGEKLDASMTAITAEPPKGAEEIPPSVQDKKVDSLQKEDAIQESIQPQIPQVSPKVIEGRPLESSISTVEKTTGSKNLVLPPSVVKLKRRRQLKRILAVSAGLLLLGGAGTLYILQTGGDVPAENRQLIADVAKRAIVPADEVPSITTVVDETQVNQEFLRGTRKGDKVLLYFQAGRAVVYRPSSGQVVNMGPLETPKPRVFIRQGSPVENTSAVAAKISGSSEYLLASTDDSPKKTYAKTVVVDVSGTRPDIAARLGLFLGVPVVALPDGESRPDADLMVLVGSDYK